MGGGFPPWRPPSSRTNFRNFPSTILNDQMEFAAREWHGEIPWDISERRTARSGRGLGLNQAHFFGGSESQGVQVPQQPVSRAAPLPAATRPPRELDVAEHSARALVTHPTARGAAVTPQAAGRASKTHPRSEGARTPAAASAAATAAVGGRHGTDKTDGGNPCTYLRSAVTSHHAPPPARYAPRSRASKPHPPRKGADPSGPSAATTAAVRGRHGAEREVRACTYPSSIAASHHTPPPLLIHT